MADVFGEFGGAEEQPPTPPAQADDSDPFGAFGGAAEEPFVPTKDRPSAAKPFPPAKTPTQDEEPGFLERVGQGVLGFATGVAQGAPLGARSPLDYAKAAGEYAYQNLVKGTDVDWQTALDEARADTARVEREAPIAHVAGQIGGALATAIPTGGFGTVKLGTQAAAKAMPALAARLGAEAGVMTAKQAGLARLGAAVAGLATAGAASGAQQQVVRSIDEAVATGDYSGVAERLLPSVLKESAKGAALDLGIGAAGGATMAGIRKLVQSGAGDWVSGRAFKAILGITNRKGVKLADKRIPGGKEELGRAMLDEGVVTPDASFDEIAERLGQKREEVGRLLGEARQELDATGQGASRTDLWNHIDEQVLKPLKESPVKKKIGEALEEKLSGLKEYLLDRVNPGVSRVRKTVAESEPFDSGVLRAEKRGDQWFYIPADAKNPGTVDTPGLLGRARVSLTDDPELATVGFINAASRGKGTGTRLYAEMADFAEEQGRKLASDTSEVRTDLANAWWNKRVKEGLAEFDEARDRYILTGRLPQQKPLPAAPVRELSPIIRDSIGFDELTRIRQDMDDVLKWESLSNDVGLESYRNVRRALNEYWMDSAEKAAAAAGNPDLVQRIKSLTSRYAKLSLADDLAKEGQAARAANRFFSASDYGVGGASSVIGALASGGSALPAMAASAVGATANKIARERGNQVVAGTLYGMSKRLLGVQERVQKAASLERLLDTSSKVSTAKAATADPKLTLAHATRGLADAEEMLDPETERSREFTSLMNEIEMELGPEAAQAVRQQVEKRAQFLLDKAPPTPPPSVFNGNPKRELGDEDAESIKRYMDAVDDPSSALERLGNGEETAEDMDTLGSLYPSMLQDFRNQATQALSRMKTPPSYEEQLALVDKLGIALTPDTDPTSVAYWQGVAASSAAAQQQSAPPPRQRASGYKNNSDEVMTTADKLA